MFRDPDEEISTVLPDIEKRLASFDDDIEDAAIQAANPKAAKFLLESCRWLLERYKTLGEITDMCVYCEDEKPCGCEGEED